MALRMNLVYPNSFPWKSTKPQTNWVPSMYNSAKFQKCSCTKDIKDMTDLELATDFGIEIGRMNARKFHKEAALKKSKEILFLELCDHAGLNSEEMKKKWKGLSDEDKWVLVKDFVQHWASHFHPLSARSVKQFVDEYLVENTPASTSTFFPGLRKFLGFLQDE